LWNESFFSAPQLKRNPLGGTNNVAESFVIDTTFRLTNRGLVLATRQWTGTIRVGQRVMLPNGRGEARPERITAIETGRKTDEQGRTVTWIGLLLGELPTAEIAQVEAHLRPGATLAVEDPERAA